MTSILEKNQSNNLQLGISISDEDLYQKLASILNGSNFEVFKLNSNSIPEFSVIIADPKSWEALSADNNCNAEIIIITKEASTLEFESMIKSGAFWCISDTTKKEEILALITKAFVINEIKSINQDLLAAVSGNTWESDFISASPIMNTFLDKVRKVSNLDSSLLLTGENGTGKTLLARTIHARSNRRDKPFVVVSCAAIPRDLIESELFGYEKGSFTGATNSRPGSFELANEGTIFLDEIGDLPLELQPKLLSILQDRKVKRIGASKEIILDVRIIAATNIELEKAIQEKKFRQDLFFRLNVLSLKIPPLRERVEDIEPLSQYILSRISKKRGTDAFRLSNQSLEKLKKHTWPGNVRELENILERASAFSNSNILEIEDLNTPYTQVSQADLPALSGFKLEDIEAKAIKDTLVKYNGNKQEAANSLGISTKSIYNKIEKYGIKI
ncbi:MAG: sigma-54-dependent Fis family transcriptional regulator [Bdellovibrionales bacterium]|nr:sigma-54-dependent Fis family transcriptional regulator [Bdellovibrionales bacterium]